MYNLQLIYSIQPAKCYHNIGSAVFAKLVSLLTVDTLPRAVRQKFNLAKI